LSFLVVRLVIVIKTDSLES